jgi:hypothetical protein
MTTERDPKHRAGVRRAWSFADLWLVVFLADSERTASAQELFVAMSLDGTSYQGDPCISTDGDRAGERAVAVETSRGMRFSGGLFVGKFDEPISDPSFTGVGLFFEPSFVLRRTARVRPVVGARLAWEHQRVGDQSKGLWAYGWSAGGTAGLLSRLGEPVSVGLWTVVSGLNVDRQNGTSRNGLRVQVGATLMLTWPID